MTTPSTVSPAWLTAATAAVLEGAGLAPEPARALADSLVDADAHGVASHGVMLVPMYVERLRAGSVSTAATAHVVRDDGGAGAVLDAGHALGQLTAVQAMGLAVEKAKRLGVGAVAVRGAFHFGRALPFAQLAAAQGCIGVAMANTRPLMPAPGGAEPVVGNNPVAVAAPGDPGLGVDMALSEAALGKIRIAAAEGRPIPETWATDADGVPTADPAAALEGMLLPAGGAKGFGLALVVDVLAGVLSGGAFGTAVAPLYQDTAVPNDCAHFFLAIDVEHFVGREAFAAGMAQLAAGVLGSRPRPGADPVVLPGQRGAALAARAAAEGIVMDPSTLEGLQRAAAAVGVDLPRTDMEAIR
ncbi:Ldh family oxidoreductase [Georgenia thermotolerans]|uniref:Ldh family oxidoreductase n=1 Tax=Georgenia thermotolerans TaxID=527326 RepID=A0A7J5UV08_9MICO|nr:Ldh family oxidoreductase [Georgenia thermotolerans]KAE8766106.1 Ldh family oxidoreductase [Georgenia thermotolerans]